MWCADGTALFFGRFSFNLNRGYGEILGIGFSNGATLYESRLVGLQCGYWIKNEKKDIFIDNILGIKIAHTHIYILLCKYY